MKTQSTNPTYQKEINRFFDLAIDGIKIHETIKALEIEATRTKRVFQIIMGVTVAAASILLFI